MKHRAIFLDRDGVLNHVVIKNGKPYPPANVAELTIPADVKAALHMLKAAGFLLIGATNQPDVARGTTAKVTVEAINSYLMSELPLDEIRVCYHDDADNCECRKPSPGLLTRAACELGIDLTQSFMIGDRWKDIEAGQNAGCLTIWLDNQYQEKKPLRPDFVATNLTQAAEWIKNNFPLIKR
ncbi:MAG: D-glycero-alpha-D-manno-heptose-1,7-bisphosphate 7-phosphatase [Gammaproteobacteria bacterium]